MPAGLRANRGLVAAVSGVRLVYCVSAPAIECVVERHGGFELGEIVPIHARIAERCREQTGRLRRELELSGISTADDYRKARKRIRTEPKLLKHHVKSALNAPLVPERPSDVEGRCLELLRYSHHFGGPDEEEDSLAINKAADQPGAGDAHDFRPCPRDPDGAALGIACRHFVR